MSSLTLPSRSSLDRRSRSLDTIKWRKVQSDKFFQKIVLAVMPVKSGLRSYGGLQEQRNMKMGNGLVSIIMLSHGDCTHVVETVRSVLAQSYQNWELLFVAESNDDTLALFSELREEDIKKQIEAGKDLSAGSYRSSRIRASYISDLDAITPRRNFALKEAKGRWIAFLDAGDIWEPTKLERQISFMEGHGYAFSYTQYGIIDKDSLDRGFVIGGKDRVTYQDMMRCCWPAYLPNCDV